MSERRRKRLEALVRFANETALGRLLDIIAGKPPCDCGDIERVVDAANGNRLAGTAYRAMHGELRRAVVWFAQSLRLAVGPRSDRMKRSQTVWEAVWLLLGYHFENEVITSLAIDIEHNDAAEAEWARQFAHDAAERADLALHNLGLTEDRCPELHPILDRLHGVLCDLYEAVGRSAYGDRFDIDCRPPFRPWNLRRNDKWEK